MSPNEPKILQEIVENLLQKNLIWDMLDKLQEAQRGFMLIVELSTKSS